MGGLLDKVLIAVVSPLVTALLAWLLAGLLWAGRRKRGALVLAAAAWLWLFIWSMPPVSFWLRGCIERQFPFTPADRLPSAQAIVVLGGAVNAGQAGEEPNLTGAADRLWFAARLYRAGKAPTIILSGGSLPPERPEAEAMRALMIDLGVPDSAMLMEGSSHNTRENAAFAAQILRRRGIHRILLVSSALHMPRAIRLFRAEGLEVVAATTDVEVPSGSSQYRWIPSADALEGAGRAMKELLAICSGP